MESVLDIMLANLTGTSEKCGPVDFRPHGAGANIFLTSYDQKLMYNNVSLYNKYWRNVSNDYICCPMLGK